MARTRCIPQFGHRRCVASRSSSPGPLIWDSTRVPQFGQASASRSLSGAFTASASYELGEESGRRCGDCRSSRPRDGLPRVSTLAQRSAFVLPASDLGVAGRAGDHGCRPRAAEPEPRIEWSVSAGVLHQPGHCVLLTAVRGTTITCCFTHRSRKCDGCHESRLWWSGVWSSVEAAEAPAPSSSAVPFGPSAAGSSFELSCPERRVRSTTCMPPSAATRASTPIAPRS
jgi:hypothetical protein